MDPATCPRCHNTALDDQPLVRHCPRCKGSWISEAALHQRVDAAQGATRGNRLSWHVEARAALRCAICSRPMETLVVRDAPVDRCPAHGIWFDVNELAHVLGTVAVVTSTAAAASSHGIAAGDVVEGAVELAVDGLDAAAMAGAVVETGGGVFEVVVDGIGVVAEAVVDALAAIFSAIGD